jgi:hypothetical protein
MGGDVIYSGGLSNKIINKPKQVDTKKILTIYELLHDSRKGNFIIQIFTLFVTSRVLMMIMDRPAFSETLWEWRAFGDIDANSLHQISHLPKRHDRTGNLKDDYLWVPECSLNVKLRAEGIRIKRLLSEAQDGSIKKWITEAYNFPISSTLFNMILADFKLELPQKEKAIQTREQLLSTLQSASAAIRMITVDKHREQYLWQHNNNRNGRARGEGEGGEVAIEIATIHRPELVTSISIEHEDLDKVDKALKYLQLPSESMKVLSYLDCLERWAYGKNCSKGID